MERRAAGKSSQRIDTQVLADTADDRLFDPRYLPRYQGTARTLAVRCVRTQKAVERVQQHFVGFVRVVATVLEFVSDTWPCPDPNFAPAAGQSLYDFLVADSGTYLMTAALDVTLDGRKIRDGLDYHYISENVFSIKGDPSLQATFDTCITGSWQPVVSNG